MRALTYFMPGFACVMLGLALSSQAAVVKPQPKLTVIMDGAEPQDYSLAGVRLGMTPDEAVTALTGRFPQELPSLTANYRITIPDHCLRRQVKIYPGNQRFEEAPFPVPCEDVVPGVVTEEKGYAKVQTYYQVDEFRPNSYVARLSRSNGIYVVTVYFSERVDVTLNRPLVSARASRVEVRFMSPEPDPVDTARFYAEAVNRFGEPVPALKATRRKARGTDDAIWCLNKVSPQPPICSGAPYLRMPANARRLQLIDQTDYEARVQAYLDWQAAQGSQPPF